MQRNASGSSPSQVQLSADALLCRYIDDMSPKHLLPLSIITCISACCKCMLGGLRSQLGAYSCNRFCLGKSLLGRLVQLPMRLHSRQVLVQTCPPCTSGAAFSYLVLVTAQTIPVLIIISSRNSQLAEILTAEMCFGGWGWGSRWMLTTEHPPCESMKAQQNLPFCCPGAVKLKTLQIGPSVWSKNKSRPCTED